MVNRLPLLADCSSCFGLCCVALAFERSADFATDKDAGEPCVNLEPDFGCGIHADLRDEGYRGCTVYDCFGAGQKVSQVTFGGVSWREAPGTSVQMFAMLPIMRQLHELLWYLAEAVDLPAASLRGILVAAFDDTERWTLEPPDVLAELDVSALRDRVDMLLSRVSKVVRADLPAKDHRGANLFGANLRGVDLRGADLRGAYLIAADLSGADLRGADLIGADFRDTKLAGADLTGSIFLTQAQVNAADGDEKTRLPGALVRPAHWTG